MESLLLFDEFFNAIVYYSGRSAAQSFLDLDNLFWLWTLSCEYGMRRLRSRVEDVLTKGDGLARALCYFGNANAKDALDIFSSRGFEHAAVSLLKILRETKKGLGCSYDQLRV